MIRTAATLFLLLTLLTGVIYPLSVTAIAQLVFPNEANGSLVDRGSSLIGQRFTKPEYFWGRASAIDHDPRTSGGSNLGPSNPALTERIRARTSELGSAGPAPSDLVTASGSGLDPDISLAGARYQAPRVAKARGITERAVLDLIEAHGHEPIIGLFGEPRINVLELNRALDALGPLRAPIESP